MPLTRDQTKRLIRLQSEANELVVAARRAADKNSTSRSNAIQTLLDGIIGQVRATLEEADARLLKEFDAVVHGAYRGAHGVEALAVAVFGWIKGAVEAEAFEMRMQAEADAYARERVRAERPVGFSGPPAPEQ